jgi:hypothetical protein
VNIFIADISCFIEKLPNAELTLEPIFGGHAIDMRRRATAGSLMLNR